MDLELSHIPRLLVFNKTDLVEPDFARASADALSGVLISAKEKKTLSALLKKIETHLWDRFGDICEVQSIATSRSFENPEDASSSS
jgi:50S ribosomal subunit-associated GTPase HflX